MNIEPGKCIGQFTIGDVATNDQLYSRFIKLEDNKFQFEEVSFRINDDGKIYLISTSDGNYNEIKTSQTFRQIILEGNKLFYDEFNQIFYLKNPKGLCIEKPYENLSFKNLLDSKITYLTIFDCKNFSDFVLVNDMVEINKENILEFEKASIDSEIFFDKSLKSFTTNTLSVKKWFQNIFKLFN